jgi:hypothetical protein
MHAHDFFQIAPKTGRGTEESGSEESSTNPTYPTNLLFFLNQAHDH